MILIMRAAKTASTPTSGIDIGDSATPTTPSSDYFNLGELSWNATSRGPQIMTATTTVLHQSYTLKKVETRRLWTKHGVTFL